MAIEKDGAKTEKAQQVTVWERLLEVWYRVCGSYPVRMAGREYRCDPDHISFWSKVTAGDWEPQTFNTLNSILEPNGIHLDIGAWIGPTVLHAAHRSSKVFCLEPDRVAYLYLLTNLKHNRLENVIPFNMALGEMSGMARMASPRGKRGDSMTSLLHPDGDSTMDVVVIGWQQWLALVDNPVFSSIKMDIEGGEFKLLAAMENYLRQHRPPLYLSLHPHLLPIEKREREMTALVKLLRPIYPVLKDITGKHQPQDKWQEIATSRKGSSWLLLSG